jgi:hypothetical protein
VTEESNLFISIGREIKDEYGRAVGRVASFAVNPNGRIDTAYIEQGDGRVTKHPADSLKINGSEIVLQSELKMKTSTFGDQIPLIWRKNQALKNLVEKGKISPEVYEDIHGSFDGVLDQLKNEAQTLIEQIDTEMNKCTKEIKDLNYALVNLEIEHEIGKVEEDSYNKAFTVIQECLKKANNEKNDLEEMKSRLANILLGETEQKIEDFGETEQKIEDISETEPTFEEEVEETTSEELTTQEETPAPSTDSPTLPEPPVVVYVKEAGESSV